MAKEYAGFGRRLVAFLIDAAILFVAGFVIGLVLPNVAHFANIVGIVIGWLYYVSHTGIFQGVS